MRKLLSILCVFSAAAALAERQPIERYRTIVDRQMFGPPPAGFDPTKMPSEVAKSTAKADKELTQEQEKVMKAIKFSVLNVTPSGETVVGFSDNGDPKNPLHYYLKVGESQNGWTVKEADREKATMTIEKDGIEVTLTLGGDSATEAGAVNRVGGAGASRPKAASGAKLFGGAGSLRERRRQREEQIRAEEAAKHAASEARREALEKEREALEKERAAREEEAKKQREAEREEQRKQLLQIQEELRKAREAREIPKGSEPQPE